MKDELLKSFFLVRSIHHITPKKLQINVLWLIYVRKRLDNNILKV